MTLMDQRFGAEIVTKKGRVYKFDDLNCLVAHLKAGQVAADQVEQLVAVDFAQKGQFVSLQKAFFLQNEALKSPMRADVAVFSDMKALENVRTLLGSGQTPTWQALQSTL
jgi:copper chaperone NosL